MHRISVCIAFSFMALAICPFDGAAQGDGKKPPPDGIYYILKKGDGFKIKRNDTGEVVVLGEKITSSLGIPKFDSHHNDNNRVSITLKGAGPFPVDLKGPFAMVIGGHCLPVGVWSGPSADNTRFVTASIKGTDTVIEIAKLAGAESQLRKHPGHKLAVKFESDKQVYDPKEKVMVTMSIQNVGDVTITFLGGLQYSNRDSDFDFTAIRDNGRGKAILDKCDPGDFLGIGIDRTLKPGETFKKSVRLDERFKFEAGENYQITGAYHLWLVDPADERRTLWQDFAGGRCTILIRDK
jgi:hypothetical protein